MSFDADGNRLPSTANFELSNLLVSGPPGNPTVTIAVRARSPAGRSWDWKNGARELSGVIYGGDSLFPPPQQPPGSGGDDGDDTTGSGPFLIPLVVTLSLFVCFALIFVVVSLVRRRRLVDAVKAQHAAQLSKLDRCVRAVSSISQLSHSMNLIRFGDLKAAGRLLSHEEARKAGLLHTIDTFDELQPYLSRHPTVFISHQWLDATEPDPFNVHFEALCQAMALLCDGVSGMKADDMHIWVDYTCVPQKNVSQQRLAINALSVYASACMFFLVIAPTTHGRQIMSDRQSYSAGTYSSRGWCRLEHTHRT